MLLKILVFASIATTVLTAVAYPASRGSQNEYPSYSASDEDKYYDPPKYSFEYKIKDDQTYNDFGQQETRDGDYTSGVYYVLLPDGRLQTVTYTADQNGYVADVQYTGEPKYDYAPKAKYDQSRYKQDSAYDAGYKPTAKYIPRYESQYNTKTTPKYSSQYESQYEEYPKSSYYPGRE